MLILTIALFIMVSIVLINTASETVAAATDGASGHGLVLTLSLLCIAAGAVPAYALYLSRMASPAALLDAHAPLRSLYGFFWRRWAIDACYHRVFVNGTLRLAAFVAGGLEARWDRLVHHRLPWVVTRQTEHLARRMRTETEELVYNVSYVLVLFVLLLAVLLRGPGND